MYTAAGANRGFNASVGYLSTAGLLVALMVAARPLFYYWLDSAYVSELPLVFRAVDPTYLSNDPYICEMQDLNLRTLPTHAIAALTFLIGFDAAMLLQHLLTLSIAASAAWIIARRAFGASELAALLAIVLILFIDPGTLGYEFDAISRNVGLPREIAKALCLLALAFWLTRRWALLATSLLGAAVFQPSYPIGLGLILLAVYIASLPAKSSAVIRVALTVIVVVVSLMVGVMLERIAFGPADDLVRIIAEFRNPHHMLWSEVRIWSPFTSDGFIGALFIGSAALLLLVMLGDVNNRGLLVCIGVITLSFAGFILIDPFPSRLGIALPGSRLLFIVPFLGTLAGVTVLDRLLFVRYPGIYSRVENTARVIGSSTVTKSVTTITVLGVVTLLLAPFFSFSASQLARQAGYAPTSLYRTLGSKDKRAIAREMQALPTDALVLAPPDFGVVRILARRAIYVDFNSWPFSAPLAWATRMEEAYGPLDRPGGFPWMRRAKAAWKKTPCVDLLARAARLGGSHVVVMNRDDRCPEPVMSAGGFMVLSTRQFETHGAVNVVRCDGD